MTDRRRGDVAVLRSEGRHDLADALEAMSDTEYQQWRSFITGGDDGLQLRVHPR